mmetsp:Transcript_25718/g.52718  ORF Transcript_25718/g.52718 Transcript_25718/m.52718 type:complete len:272 (+) Transcript_25718:86-901(+)
MPANVLLCFLLSLAHIDAWIPKATSLSLISPESSSQRTEINDGGVTTEAHGLTTQSDTIHGLTSSRRKWFSALVLTTLPMFGDLSSAQATEKIDGCVSQSDPFKTVNTCVRFGRDREGRLRPIAADENGVSCSSVRNPSRFAAPWNYSTFSIDSVTLPKKIEIGAVAAWNDLKREVSAQSGVVVLESVDGPEDYYLRATAPTPGSSTSSDDIEFTLKPEDQLVLFRSVTREAVFLYPLQQPVSDRGSNLQRLEEIRSRLGWGKLKYDQEEY